MTLGYMVAFVSPEPGYARLSSFTSLHHGPQCHSQRTWLALNDSMHSDICGLAWLADSGRRAAQWSEVKEEPEGRGTRTQLSATPSWVQK